MSSTTLSTFGVGGDNGTVLRRADGLDAQTVRASNWTSVSSTASVQLGAEALITHDLVTHKISSKTDAVMANPVAADIVLDSGNLSIVTQDVNATSSYSTLNARLPIDMSQAPAAAGIATSACAVDSNGQEITATIHPSGFFYDEAEQAQKVYLDEVPSSRFSSGDFVKFFGLPPAIFPGGLPGIYQVIAVDDTARTITLATDYVAADVAPFVTVGFGPLSQELQQFTGASASSAAAAGASARVCKATVWFTGVQTAVLLPGLDISEGDIVQVAADNWETSVNYTKMLEVTDVAFSPVTITAASDDVQIFNSSLPDGGMVVGLTTGRPKTLAAIEPGNNNLILEGLADYAPVFSGVTDSVYLGNYEDSAYALIVPSGNTANVAIGQDAGRDWSGTYSTMIGAEAGAGESGGVTERFTGFGKWAGSPGLPGEPLIGSDVTAFGQFGSSNSQPAYPSFEFSTRFGAKFHEIQAGATKIGGEGASHCLLECVSVGFDLDVGLQYENYFRNTKISPLETQPPEIPPSFVIPTTDSVLIGGRITLTDKVVGDAPYTNVIAIGFNLQYIHDRSLLFGAECEPLVVDSSSAVSTSGAAPVPASGPIGYIPLVYRNQPLRVPVYKVQ